MSKGNPRITIRVDYDTLKALDTEATRRWGVPVSNRDRNQGEMGVSALIREYIGAGLAAAKVSDARRVRRVDYEGERSGRPGADSETSARAGSRATLVKSPQRAVEKRRTKQKDDCRSSPGQRAPG